MTQPLDNSFEVTHDSASHLISVDTGRTRAHAQTSIAPARRLGRIQIALRRVDLQRRLELCQLTRGLADAALLALLARLSAASLATARLLAARATF